MTDRLASAAVLGSVLLSAQVFAADRRMPEGPIDPARVEAIAKMLDDAPYVPGPKLADRAAWAALAATPAYADVVQKANAALEKPMPAMTLDVYSEYSKTGQRTKHYGDVRSDRHNRIALYTLAECIENRGRFIQPLEDVIASVCEEPTWTYNFHDPNLDYWNGKEVFVDLGAPVPAHDMTMSLGLLGDKLDEKTRSLIIDNCNRKILDPYRACITGQTNLWWWINAPMNWNSVCHEGVIGVALGIVKDKHERALFIASAEKYTPIYISGFGGDGYCAEGMGYWSYGFGRFLMLAEEVSQATHGGVDLFDIPGASLAAAYPARIEIINGVRPAYADGGGGSPDKEAWTFASRRYGLEKTQDTQASLNSRWFSVASGLMVSCPNSTSDRATASQPSQDDGLRTYFAHGGVLNCRPTPGSAGKLGVSLKGGNNDEPHNHNDLGTFVLVVGDQPLVLDPGGDTYTADTFSKNRYKNPALNSFGHPVPKLAGQLQLAGKTAVAKITAATFTDDADVYEMDLTSAYAVKSLQSIVRRFDYNRRGDGSLTVTDTARFDSPQSFESALITLGQWKQEADGSLLLWQNGQAARVRIEAGGAAVDVSADSFPVKATKPTRIAVKLHDPAANVKLVMTFTPAAVPSGTTQP